MVSAQSVRMLRIAPFGAGLDLYLRMFADEKDGGSVLLTHIYLLAGTSLPIWLHAETSSGRLGESLFCYC